MFGLGFRLGLGLGLGLRLGLGFGLVFLALLQNVCAHGTCAKPFPKPKASYISLHIVKTRQLLFSSSVTI